MRTVLAIASALVASCARTSEPPQWPPVKGSVTFSIVEAPVDDPASAGVVGTAVDATDGSPLREVPLVADDAAGTRSWPGVTDRAGRFVFADMEPGTYIVHVFYVDDLATPRFEVHAGRSTILSLRVRYGGPSHNEVAKSSPAARAP